MASRSAGRRVTVRDIAAHTGVSIATVSRVLNGQAHVAPETRELVEQAAERLRLRAPGPAGVRPWQVRPRLRRAPFTCAAPTS